jgi:outer membrane receptor protein involved in Fe transport
LNQRVGGAYDAAGIPYWSGSGSVDYRFDSGLGAELSGWFAGGWYTNLSYSVRVPASYNLDLRLYYQQPRWDVAIMVLNLTDEKSFVNGLPGSTSEFLQPMRPLTVQARLAVRL